jgi:Cd2+/Zn2+-exporting ATPase
MLMHVEQQQFKIDGMDCAEEVAVLKKELGPIVGGEDRLSFDLLNAKLTISTGSVAVTPETILVAVARTGMKAEVWQDGPKPTSKDSLFQRWGRTLLTGVSGLFTVVGPENLVGRQDRRQKGR